MCVVKKILTCFNCLTCSKNNNSYSAAIDQEVLYANSKLDIPTLHETTYYIMNSTANNSTTNNSTTLPIEYIIDINSYQTVGIYPDDNTQQNINTSVFDEFPNFQAFPTIS